MELIVKIGADQQGLADTITRIKTQFNNMNTSAPESWAGARGGSGRGAIMKLSRGQQEYLDQQDDEAGGGLSKYTGKAIVKKSTKYLKGLLFAEIANLAVEALDVLGKSFWEKVYGADEATIARIEEAHKRMHATILGLRISREDLKSRIHEMIIQNASPEVRKDLLKKDKEEADAKFNAAQEKFNAARTDLQDAQSGKIRKGVEERKLTADERGEYIMAFADAETKMLQARLKQFEAANRYSQALTAAVKSEIDNKPKESQKEKAEGREDKNLSFHADSLAQAGLFAGSSLLFNPNFTVQNQQLEVLQAIKSNTDRLGEGDHQ